MMQTSPHAAAAPPVQLSATKPFSLSSLSPFGSKDEGVVFGWLVLFVFVFVTTVEYVRTKRAKDSAKREQYANAAVWGVMLTMTAAGCSVAPEMVAQRHDISILLTVGASLELLGFGLLWLAPRRCTDLSVPRAPSSFAVLISAALGIRVVVEMLYNGYLPVDSTGDGLLQIMNFLALVMTVYRLGAIDVVKGESRWVTLLAAVSMAFGYVCYGELDDTPSADKAYAISIYLELGAWLMMFSFVYGRGRDAVNSSTFPLIVVSAMCKSYFWYVAMPETRARHPNSWLMAQFPIVLLMTHIAIGVLALGMSVRVITEFKPSFSLQALLNPDNSFEI
jgi:hypothetical protein